MEATDFRILGLNRIFSEAELIEIKKNQSHIIAILSYFATSLFDKDKVDDVLWDITENCIARLGLEDCVIYLLDEKTGLLQQRAAFGNKNQGERKILSPIAIPLGQGIVGAVAQSGRPETVDCTLRDPRYILDDLRRQSELCVPLKLNKKVIGVIDSEHSEEGFYNAYHLFLFELIAALTTKKLMHLSTKSKAGFTNDNAYYTQLQQLLENEKIFKDGQLSLSDTSERLNISANYLSQIVNTLSGCSFSDLVNRHRVREAKRFMEQTQYENYTMAAIAYESGFNSTSAFYSAFKKLEGVTPSVYRKK